jgi:hypothetical protein
MEKIIKKIKFTNNSVNIIINLNNNYYDVGFYSDSGYDNDNIDTNVKSVNINGVGISRLNELKKYTESENIFEKYKLSINGSDGVITSETNENNIVYIIDNIKFFDNLNDGSTQYQYTTPTQHNDLNKNILYKDDRYLNFVNYKKQNNIEILRQSLNIFESHIRLTDIRNVEELTLYGGGYYNIINNS